MAKVVPCASCYRPIHDHEHRVYICDGCYTSLKLLRDSYNAALVNVHRLRSMDPYVAGKKALEYVVRRTLNRRLKK